MPPCASAACPRRGARSRFNPREGRGGRARAAAAGSRETEHPIRAHRCGRGGYAPTRGHVDVCVRCPLLPPASLPFCFSYRHHQPRTPGAGARFAFVAWARPGGEPGQKRRGSARRDAGHGHLDRWIGGHRSRSVDRRPPISIGKRVTRARAATLLGRCSILCGGRERSRDAAGTGHGGWDMIGPTRPRLR
ncbi:hypothetical protein SEVIR_4G096450v4 [Setaria viridis]